MVQRNDRAMAYDARLAGHFNNLRRETMSRRGLLKGAAAGAAAMGLAGAASPFLPGMSVLAQDENTIVFGLEGDVRGLEPALSYDFTANPVACQISEGLMYFAPDGSLQPLLAESFEQPDGTTFIYKLRSGLTFHDGSAVTSADVLASIARVRDPEVAGPMAWMYDDVSAVAEAVDELTVKITIAAPSALFKYVFGTTAGHVVPAAAIEQYGLDLAYNPIGTGPFKFVSWEQGNEIVLERNDNYWMEGPFVDRFIYKIVPDGTTRVTGMKTGDLSMINSVPPDQVETVKAMENVAWQEVVGYTINYYAFNTTKAPFDNPSVRKAVGMAIPWADIMANIVRDTGVQATSTVPSNMPGSAEGELPQPVTDVEGAKALLAEAGYADGFATQIHVIAPNDIWIPQALAVQQALAEIGIQAEINQLPYADMITLEQAGDWEGMKSSQWGSDFPDAAGMLQPLFLSTSVPPQNNHSRYNNPRVDELLAQQDAELDPAAREAMLKEIQTLIAEDAPVLFFEHFKWYMPISTAFTGYEVGPLWYWDCWGRTLRPAGA
jgi:peptide/nickel transport system substrate-binding protein